MTNQIPKLKNCPAHENPPPVYFNNQGGAMLYLISVIMVMSVLGAAMLNMVSTSTLTQISINQMDRAYFMADAGINYYYYAISLGKEKETPKKPSKKPSKKPPKKPPEPEDFDGKIYILKNENNNVEGQFKFDSNKNNSWIISTIDMNGSTVAEAKRFYD